MIDSISAGLWKSCAIKAIRVGWLPGIEVAGKRLSPVKLSTDSPGTDYDEPETAVVLHEKQPGVFISGPQLLVSSTTDQTINGVHDYHTHLVALDAVIYAEYPGTQHKVAAYATGDKTVTFHINILKVNNAAVVTSDDVAADLKQVAERYAQMQIKIAYKIEAPTNPPAGVLLGNGLEETGKETGLSYDTGNLRWYKITTEEKYLFDETHLRTRTDDDIEVYYVNSLSSGGFAESFAASLSPGKYKNSIVIQAEHPQYETLAHEAGHLLYSPSLHTNAVQSLMFSNGVSSHTILSPLRITDREATKARNSPLAK
jgi:hypothetical protein